MVKQQYDNIKTFYKETIIYNDHSDVYSHITKQASTFTIQSQMGPLAMLSSQTAVY